MEWNGYKVQPTSYLAPSGDWELKQVIVKGTGGPVKLLFRESLSKGASDGSGPYIDDIVLKPIQVTAPPTSFSTPLPDVCELYTDNLVCNGSFELNVVDAGTKKEFADYLVPGWTSSTGTVCLSNYAYGVPAYEGKNYAELDCIAGGPVEGLYQMVPTLEDQEYALSFKMRARDPYPNTEDEGVNVSYPLSLGLWASTSFVETHQHSAHFHLTLLLL